MQVYADLSVLTARPTAADEATVPHALYGHVDAAQAHSVAAWLDEAAAAIADVRAAGRLPIVVGGSGLYLAALTEGLSPVPPVPAEVRARWRARSDAPAALHAELATRDPVMAARLRLSDPQRIVRALEVIDGTGRSLADWQNARSAPVLPLGPEVIAVAVVPNRGVVRTRIAERVLAMMAAGAVDEAAALVARGLPEQLPAMKAIGVVPLAAHAAGRLTRSAAIEQVVTDTRQYAKRQETWIRQRFSDWPRVVSAQDVADDLRG